MGGDHKKKKNKNNKNNNNNIKHNNNVRSHLAPGPAPSTRGRQAAPPAVPTERMANREVGLVDVRPADDRQPDVFAER